MFEELVPIWGYVAAGFLVGIGLAVAWRIIEAAKKKE
jgi:hypothetical protein